MDKERLKLIVRNLKLLVDSLESEVHSDVDAYRSSKVFPSKIVINLKKTNYLANTIKDNEKYIIGSNGKLIDDKISYKIENFRKTCLKT